MGTEISEVFTNHFGREVFRICVYRARNFVGYGSEQKDKYQRKE